MNITIRLETERDYKEVEHLTREAFWDMFQPGCHEHLVSHQLRKVSSFVEALDFVALDDDQIVGNIMYTKAEVRNEQGESFEVLCMGPLSVLPDYQGKKIGSQLMMHSIEVAKALGYGAIIIFGHPKYYHRFGFVSAERFGIQTSKGENFDAFMALELYEGALDGVSGRFYEDPAFKVQKEDLEAFEKQFPYKEKKRTDKLFDHG